MLFKSKGFGWGILVWVLLLARVPLLAVEPVTVEGRLKRTSETLSGFFYDVYFFEGVAGESVFIELSSEEFDAVLILLDPLVDPEGNSIIANNKDSEDSVEEKNAQIAVVLQTTGTYRIIATTSEKQKVGSYSLSWRDASETEVKKTLADVLFQQGIQQSQVNQFKEALASWEQSLKLYRELGDRQGQADSLESLGFAYLILGEYQQAIHFHQQSLALKREIGDRQGQADSLGGLGIAYGALGDYQRALDLYQQQLTIAREVGDRQREALSLNNLGNTYDALGDYQQAIHFHQQSLVLKREIGDRQGQADSLDRLGLAYTNLGEYQQAIHFHQQSLALKREIGDRQGQADSLNNLGAVYFSLGDYQRAIKFYRQSLTIDRETDNRGGEANSLSNLGHAYLLLGDYQQALEFLDQSLAIFREIGDRSGEAVSLNHLGHAYSSLGDYQRAIDFHQQSLAIAKEISDRREEANSLNNLGAVYSSLGDYQRAIDFYQQSLAIKQNLGDYMGEANSLNNLGAVYSSLGDYQRAIDFYQQSLVIKQEIGHRQGEANSLGNLGTVYSFLGDYQRAIDFHQQSLAIAREIGYRAGEGSSLSNIGRVFEEQEQPELSIVFYKESVNIREGIRSGIRGLSRKLQESYTSTIAGTYRSLADLLLSQGRILEAQQVLELLKIQEIRDYTRSRNAGGEKAKVELFIEEEEILETHTNLILFSQELEKCARTQCTKKKKEDLKKLEEKLFDAYIEAVSKLKQVFRDKDDEETLNPKDFSLAKFRNIVNSQPGTVLIYPFVTENRLWLLLATKQGVFTAREITNVNQDKIINSVNNLRQLLDRPDTSLEKIKVVSKQLYDWLIEPIEEELEAGKIQHLVFSLDSAIRYIPMAVLYDGEEFLIQKYDVTTILSAELTNFTGSLPDRVAETPILGLGLSKAVGDFDALPHVETELDEIVREDHAGDRQGLFPGIKLLNEDFTWNKLLENVRGRKVLHIATHGKFSPVSQEGSYLVLGTGERLPVSKLARLQNGYLSETHLVVLSACQTAVSNQSSGGAEINSISYYFLSGGAEAVIGSLWEVRDKSTSELMQRFYGYLVTEPGITKAKALRKAQRSLLEKSQSQFVHPHYWAPFILLGNGL